MLSLEDIFCFVSEKKYSNLKLKEKPFVLRSEKCLYLNLFANIMHLHGDFLDISFINSKVERKVKKNNLTYQEIPDVSPADIFILC